MPKITATSRYAAMAPKMLSTVTRFDRNTNRRIPTTQPTRRAPKNKNSRACRSKGSAARSPPSS